MSGISIDNGGAVRLDSSLLPADVQVSDGLSRTVAGSTVTLEVNHDYSNKWFATQLVSTASGTALSGLSTYNNGVGVAGAAGFGDMAMGVFGMASSGTGVCGYAQAAGVALRGEISTSVLQEERLLQLYHRIPTNIYPSVGTTIVMEHYLPSVSSYQTDVLALKWITGYESVAAGSDAVKHSLWLKTGNSFSEAYTLSTYGMKQPATTYHIFGSAGPSDASAMGVRSDGTRMQYKDNNGSWTDIYHSHTGTSTAPGVADTAVPSAPSYPTYSWRTSGQLGLSWLNIIPTMDGNRLIHDYELELAYDSSFENLFYHQHLGRQTEAHVSVNSFAPAFDIRLPDGLPEFAIETIETGFVDSGDVNSLQDAAKNFITDGVVAGMVCLYVDPENKYSHGTISSVSATSITVEGMWSTCYYNSSNRPTANALYWIVRTLFETVFRDYVDPTSNTYGYIGSGDTTGFVSGTTIENGYIVGVGDLFNDYKVAINTIRYPMHDPNYFVEGEFEIKNPFNTGHVAVGLRSSAATVALSPVAYLPTYYACALDFGNGGLMSHNGCWVEKQNCPIITEIGSGEHNAIDGPVLESRTTLSSGISSSDTSISVTDGSIFTKSVSIATTGSSFTAITFRTPDSIDESLVVRGTVITYNDGTHIWKAVIESLFGTTGGYSTFKIYEWFCNDPTHTPMIPTGTGSITLTFERYALLRHTATNPPFCESVKVTNVATNTLTVVRAQHGSTARAFSTGTTIGPRFTPEYGKRYRISASIENATDSTPPTMIDFYVDGQWVSSARDYSNNTIGTISVPAYSDASPYPTITVPSGEHASVANVHAGDIVQLSGYWGRIVYFDYAVSATNVIYIHQWYDNAENPTQSPGSGSCTITSTALYRPGQLAIGGINVGIGSGLKDCYVYRLNSKYLDYRIPQVYCRVRASNQIGKSSWSETVTVPCPSKMCPQLTAVDTVLDHHVFFWSFDSASPEITGYKLQGYAAPTGGTSVYERPVSNSERVLIVPMDSTYDTLYWQIAAEDPFGLTEYSSIRVKTTPTRSSASGTSMWYRSPQGYIYPGDALGLHDDYVSVGQTSCLPPATYDQVPVRLSSLSATVAFMAKTTKADVDGCGVLGIATNSLAIPVLGRNEGGGYGAGAVTLLAAAATTTNCLGIKRENTSGASTGGTGVAATFILDPTSGDPVAVCALSGEWEDLVGGGVGRQSIYTWATSKLYRMVDFEVYDDPAGTANPVMKLLSTGSPTTPGAMIASTKVDGTTLQPFTMVGSAFYFQNSVINPVGTQVALGTAANKYINIKPPDSIAAHYTLTLPTTAGTSDYVLTTNGSGVLSWTAKTATASGGGWTDDGTAVRLTTASDRVWVGADIYNSAKFAVGGLVVAQGTTGSITSPAFGLYTSNQTTLAATISHIDDCWGGVPSERAMVFATSIDTTLYKRARIRRADNADGKNAALDLYCETSAASQRNMLTSMDTTDAPKELYFYCSGVRINDYAFTGTGWDCGSGSNTAALVVHNNSTAAHGNAIAGISSTNFTAAIVGKASHAWSYGVLAVNTACGGHTGYAGGFIGVISSGSGNNAVTPGAIRQQNTTLTPSISGCAVGFDYLVDSTKNPAVDSAIVTATTYGGIFDATADASKGALVITVLNQPSSAYLVGSFDHISNGGRMRLCVNGPSDFATIRVDASWNTDSGVLGGLDVTAKYLNMTTHYDVRMNGTKVLGEQGAAVANADAGTIVAQFNTLLSRLRAHGLIAT